MFFRAKTKELAHKLGNIRGYVKNLPGGDVEIYCKGPEKILLKFIDEIKKIKNGPVIKEVSIYTSKDREFKPEKTDFEEFVIIY
ncbi:acylphosphatase [Candidatus Micrarchaeota archaeon]|nr:acylphosphatase [Candidatus Micrarchaeota archaeon]